MALKDLACGMFAPRCTDCEAAYLYASYGGRVKGAQEEVLTAPALFFLYSLFIIAFGQFDKDRELWMPVADISWHAATGYEAYIIRDPVQTFGSKQEAEAFAVDVAKAWIDARVKAA
jgi:hypothetical protein